MDPDKIALENLSKSFEYFKQSLKYITLIKKENNNNIDSILVETETECNKFINLKIGRAHV